MELSRAIPWALLLSTATLVSTARNSSSSGCGGVLTDLSGRISSYVGWKTVCVWTIQMKPAYKIVLAIPFIKLNCNKEYLEIQDGLPGAKSYGKICGGVAIKYQSSFNVMTVKYRRKCNHPPPSLDVYFYGEPAATALLGRCWEERA
ncbi:carbohydrate-binding protein AQN-1-like [Camelus bactrianus]|uniref:Carbohydrate-binding protein AQN-1-like n=1 Tax=Camelus bactrianus TaxID=9837 RepID=A0A9W3F0E8_CAMBA|nr:carbohydrate-binding protein AQN-1-like [Camelus bactrianus]